MAKSLRSLIFAGVCLASPALAAGEDFAPMALNSFTFVPKRIATATVVDQNGQALGIVQKVDSDSSGKPSRIEVLMPGGQTMAIASQSASYDPVANQVVTDGATVRTAESALQPAASRY
jgi:hypothetical protein